MAESSARRHLFPLLFLACVVATLFAAPLLRDEVFTLRDHSDYFQPLRWFTAQQLRAGALPLWNPYSASGEPWLANPQTGVFYPPAWLFLALPFAKAYMLYLALHLLVLGWGAYALFVRDAAPGAALVGAVALMLSGPTLSFVDVSNNFATFAWIPLVLACARERRAAPSTDAAPPASAQAAPPRTHAAPARWSIAVDALLLASAFLGGEPFLAACAASMYAAIVFRVDRARAAAATIAAAGAGAIALSAAQLLPFLEMLRGSDRRAGLSAAEILRESMPLRQWWRVAVRPLSDRAMFDPHLAQHFIPILYVGLAVVVLAIAGCSVARARPWLAVLALAIAIGSGPAILARLPLTLFRYPARMVPFAAIALVALAVAGWNRMRPPHRWADLLLVAVLAVDLLTAAKPLLVTAPFRPHPVAFPAAVGARAKIVRAAQDAATIAANRTGWIGGYLNLYDRRFDAWTAAPVIAQSYGDYYERMMSSGDFSLARELAVGWVLSAQSSLGDGAFEAAARVGGVTAYRVRDAKPLVRLRLDDGREVPVQSFALDAESVRVRVEAPRAGLVIVAQQDAPGWRVSVDGKEVAKRLDRGILRAAAVPAGRHEVVWRYRPRTLTAGLWITLSALVWMLASLVLSARFVKQRTHKKIFRDAR
jgi:hypothetical protein